MATQYPYDLNAFVQEDSVYDPETGDWSIGEGEWVTIGKCRDEINGAGRKVTTEDGETYEYGWLVFAPKSTRILTKGTKLQVVDPKNGYVRAEKQVLRFSRDQFHCRIWL